MEPLRSCYEVDMRFYPDAPDRLTRVKWFIVPNDTPILPFVHRFGTRVWTYQHEEPPPIGELNGPRPWRGGQKPATAGLGGPCGTPEQWDNGVGLDDPLPPFWPSSEIPRCCDEVALRAIGGTGSGYLAPDLSCCPDNVWPSSAFLEYLGPDDFADLHPGDVLPLAAGPPFCWFPFQAPPYYRSPPFLWNGQSVRAVLACGLSVPPAIQFAITPDGCSFPWANAFAPELLLCGASTALFSVDRYPPEIVPTGTYKWRFFT